MSERRTCLAVLGFALLVIVATVLLLPPDVFWITDEGTKYIQLQSYVRTGEIPIEYPARILDPELQLLPDAGHHLLRYGKTVYILFLPYFALLSSVPYRMIGVHGIYVLPILSAIGTMILMFLFQRQIFSRVYPGDVLLLLFGTPVFFYTVTYWEQVPALYFSTAAFYLLVVEKDRIFWRVPMAGLLLALSTLLREEGYVLAIAAALTMLIVDRSFRRATILLLSYLLSMALPFLWHIRLYGNLLGPHGKFYSEYSSLNIPAKMAGVYEHLFRFHNNDLLNLLLAVPFLIALLLGVRRKNLHHAPVLIGGAISSAVAVLLLIISSDRIFESSAAKGLFVAVPWLILILINSRRMLFNESREIRFLGIACVLFLLGMLATLESSGTWIIWGPRFFIAILPFLLILLRRSLGIGQKNRMAGVAVVTIVICSILIQGNGIYDLALKKAGTAKIKEAIEKTGTDVILTDVFWIPQEMASLFYQKKFLLISTDDQLKMALTRLQKHGSRDFVFVAARNYRKLSNEALGGMLKSCTSRVPVLTGGMQFMEVMLISCKAD